MYFLWFTVFVEVVGVYAPFAYFTNYEYFAFVKDTVYKDNYWWYNLYMLISYSFFIYYFNSFLVSSKIKKGIKYVIVLYIIAAIINLVFSDIFFDGYSIFTSVAGTLFVLFSIFFFHFDLLKSDKIIEFKRYLPVYISIGVLIYSLIETPFDIYSEYFSTENDLFVKLQGYILVAINVIMYSTFILGFIICSKKKTT